MSLFIYLLLTDMKISLFSHHSLLTRHPVRPQNGYCNFSLLTLHSETSPEFPCKSGGWGDCLGMCGFQFSHWLNCREYIYLFLQMGPWKYSQEQRFCSLPEYSSAGKAHATVRIISFPRTWKVLRQMKLFHIAASKLFSPSSGSNHPCQQCIVLQV